MNGNGDLIKQWLWMQGMNYALEQVKWHVKPYLYPMEKENEWRYEEWETMQKNIFTYALEHWPSFLFSGRHSGHSKYDIGWDVSISSGMVTSTYNRMTVEIKWPEVKRFIQKMLEPEMEDRQMDLLELLSINAR